MNCPFQVHASMAVFWYLDDIVLDWIGQTGPGLGAKVIETRGKVKISRNFTRISRKESCNFTRISGKFVIKCYLNV